MTSSQRDAGKLCVLIIMLNKGMVGLATNRTVNSTGSWMAQMAAVSVYRFGAKVNHPTFSLRVTDFAWRLGLSKRLPRFL